MDGSCDAAELALPVLYVDAGSATGGVAHGCTRGAFWFSPDSSTIVRTFAISPGG